MEKFTWTYAILLLVSVLYPIFQSFEKRVFMYRKFKFIVPAIFATGLLFIIWDIIFTRRGIWGFNHSYTRDFYIMGLPLEEWLFFLVIPYCVFFLHDVMHLYVKKFYYPLFSKYLIWVLLLSGLFSLPFVINKAYTFTAIAFVLPFLTVQLILKTYKTWFSGFFLVYIVALIPFIVVNGFLTRIPVVWYNDMENLAIRITSIPVEDFIYLLDMLLPAFTIYHILFRRFASENLRINMGLEAMNGFYT